ncbi:putative damage-inducible protein DinB [Spirosoma lacussanchae]|uniref:DinB family protein n=1 Tax=Spirosoma lacussanchae TaxID=1884249 RepID=UPI001108446A|nr:DinB family protein [Spirosoma lacussanchae]
MENTTQIESSQNQTFLSSQQLLDHWQAHRRLTRRLIETFPDDQFFTYSLGGMRPCAELIAEILGMTGAGMEGVRSGQWDAFQTMDASSKEEVLAQWDQVTTQIDTIWPQIPSSRYQEVDLAFGLYEGTIYWFILYLIDNEIHHRAQAYVYLRTLGIEPPAFWDRS